MVVTCVGRIGKQTLSYLENMENWDADMKVINNITAKECILLPILIVYSNGVMFIESL